MKLGLVDELPLLSGVRVDDRGKECVRIVRHMEGKRLHVMSYPGERVHPGMLGEGRRLEGNSKVLEEIWRSA